MAEDLVANEGFRPENFDGKPLTIDHTHVESGCHEFVVPDIQTAHMIAYRLCEQYYPQTLPVIEALGNHIPQANVRIDGFDITYSLKRRRSRENAPQLIATIQATNNQATKPRVDEIVEGFLTQNRDFAAQHTSN